MVQSGTRIGANFRMYLRFGAGLCVGAIVGYYVGPIGGVTPPNGALDGAALVGLAALFTPIRILNGFLGVDREALTALAGVRSYLARPGGAASYAAVLGALLGSIFAEPLHRAAPDHYSIVGFAVKGAILALLAQAVQRQGPLSLRSAVTLTLVGSALLTLFLGTHSENDDAGTDSGQVVTEFEPTAGERATEFAMNVSVLALGFGLGFAAGPKSSIIKSTD